MIVASVSGWRDGRAVVDECVESLVSRGIHVVYLDGAYATYCPDARLAATPAADLPRAGSMVHVVTGGQLWRSEAEKRSRAVMLAAAQGSGASWVLVLDADERLEGEPEALAEWADAEDARRAELGMPAEWHVLNLYWPEIAGSSQPLPRLLRVGPLDIAEFRGHRDWQPWVNGRRVAYLQGEATGGADAGRWERVPREVARIRHDRQQRPGWRRAMSGRYARLHVGAPPCAMDPSGVHRYGEPDGGQWRCQLCRRPVEVDGDAAIEVPE